MDATGKKNRDYPRAHSVRLPTPPPPPESQERNEFLDYLTSLQSASRADRPGLQRSTSLFAPVVAAEDAFDHLDKLYKLMEQLLNLREQNAKLQRRVRDLEHLRHLQAMHQYVTSSVLRGTEPDIPEPDDEEAAALTDLLEGAFASKRPSKRKSVVTQPRAFVVHAAADITCGKSSGKTPAKVSKWTKVKAAFRWEKASATVSGAKSQDSGIGGIVPVNNEVARYLRVPSASDHADSGPSPADSVMTSSWTGGPSLSTPGTLSSASSTDDLLATNSEQRSESRSNSAGQRRTSTINKPRISANSDDEDGDIDAGDPAQHFSKEEFLKLQVNKSHKTPWGKVKDIIQTRKDSLKKKNRLSARSDDLKTEWSAGSDQEDVFEACEEIKPPTVTITCTTDSVYTLSDNYVKNGTYLNSDTDDAVKIIPSTVLARYQQATVDESKQQVKEPIDSPRTQRRISKWTKVKKAFLTSASKSDYESQSVPTSPTRQLHFFSDFPIFAKEDPLEKPKRKISQDDAECRRLKEEIYKNYEQLQQKLTQEFQEKLQEWEKVKSTNCSASQQIPNSIPNVEDRDPEFIRKMEEWERIKNMPESRKRNLQLTSEENLPADFRKKLQEWQKIKKFGKEDTNKKKKSNTQKPDIMCLGQPDGRQLSEDFIKKLDEWKQIKASQYNEYSERRKSLKDNKTPSPNLVRTDTTDRIIRQSKKYKVQEEKELQWLEKELQKIEKEKQRLEREREKFLEREERLAKLRKSLDSDTQKKDVLVQTSTGFFRFEGISRKFTQKLYEWEKARGISPEDSTLVLLNPGFKPVSEVYSDREAVRIQTRHEKIPGVKLVRSKSVDSVANMKCGGSLITHQPSSLSLNDMEELEMQCLTDTRPSSERDLHESEDNLDDFREPEAVIVEIEDLEEETAAPLESCVQQSQYTPIYQTEAPMLCESEKCEAPQVRRSESTRSMSSYNLIQESLNYLSTIRIREEVCKKCRSKLDKHSKCVNDGHPGGKSTGAIPKRSSTSQPDQIKQILQEELLINYKQQVNTGRQLLSSCILLQEANCQVTRAAAKDNNEDTSAQISDTSELVQDLSTEIVSMSEQLKYILSDRHKQFSPSNKDTSENNKKYDTEISELTDTITMKITELKRSLTYLCAASDLTAPGKRKKPQNGRKSNNVLTVEQSSSKNPDKRSSSDDNEVHISRRERNTEENSEKISNPSNFARIQVSSYNTNKRDCSERTFKLQLPLKQKQIDRIPCNEEDQNLSITVENPRKVLSQKKLLRTRRISDSYVGYGEEDEKQDKSPTIRNDVIVRTNSQFVDAITNNGILNPVPTSPVSVFVHTTRKIFTTFASESLKEEKHDELTDISTNIKDGSSLDLESSDITSESHEVSHHEGNSSQKEFRLPPLPASPITQRRERPLPKEASPAIRLMIARYNQKLSEQDNLGNRSGGSSGSASPVAWRSPVLERRVRAQTERYQEGLNKSLEVQRFSPLLQRKQVQKSASASFIQPLNPMPPPSVERGMSLDCGGSRSPRTLRGILKSTSTDCFVQPLTVPALINSNISLLTPPIIQSPSPTVQLDVCPILQERASRIQKAKEEFMLQGTSSSVTAKREQTSEPPQRIRNRLSQVSFGSESSCDDNTCAGLLVKSASAGMINVDEETYQQLQPEVHGPGYVSLPRQTKKKDGKFGISSLASKFRKVKMRKNNKDTQMNTISTLCRQSLLVDISGEQSTSEPGTSEQVSGLRSNKNSQSTIASNESHSSSSRTSWIKNPVKIFKSNHK